MAAPALNNINFLRKQRQRLGLAQKNDKLFALISYGVLSLVFVVTLSIFGYWQFLKQQNDLAEAQIEREKKTASSLASIEAQHLVYASRLTIIQSLFDSHTSKKRALEFISQAAIPDVSFDRLSYDNTTNELMFRLLAKNVVAVDVFLAQLREPELRAQLQSIDVSDVRRDSAGLYQLDMKVKLAEEDNGS